MQSPSTVTANNYLLVQANDSSGFFFFPRVYEFILWSFGCLCAYYSVSVATLRHCNVPDNLSGRFMALVILKVKFDWKKAESPTRTTSRARHY